MAAAKYLSKLNVNGQEYQIKDANAPTAADLASKVGYATWDSANSSIHFLDVKNNGSEIFKMTLDGLAFDADKVGGGEYDSTNHLIKFYDKEARDADKTLLFSIDATDFIKDGMVSDVAISNGNLVITFNTDAGQEPISIALTDIFNPANYYNKTEVDGKLDLKADASNVYTKSEADGKFLTEHQSLANYPTIETMNTALGQKANVSDIYTQTEIDNKLAAKADASNVYTKAEVDTQSETTAQALSNINTQLAAKANSADLATVATSGSYNDLTDKPVIPEGAVVDAALSDTSENPVQNKVVKGAIDEAKAYYISFATIATTGITDDDWDGIVAAIDAHRPIYAGYPKNNGGILYYGVECMNKNGNNTQIILTSSDDSSHYFYTFTKNGSNDYSYTVETRPYTTAAEKDAWNAKQDVISDLATIRSNAALGAKAYQKPSTGIPASDIADGVIPTVPTNVSAFTNDAGYLTQHQSLADYYTKSEIDTSIGEINDDLDLKADASSVYTKSQADARWPYNTYVSVDGETLVITSSLLR